MKIRLAGLIHNTTVNGPGIRTGIWVQGCTLACPGCCNATTWSPDGGTEWDVDALAATISEEAAEGTEGITLSGGEPFQQTRQVLELVKAIKILEPDWTVFLFTGYRLNEVKEMGEKAVLLLHALDIVVTGRFRKELRRHAKWRSSGNQEVHYLTDRYKEEPGRVPLVAEFHIGDDGRVVKTGFAGKEFRL